MEFNMENIMGVLTEWGFQYGPKVVGALAIFVIGRVTIGIVTAFVRRFMQRSKVDETLIKFVCSLTRSALLMFVVIASLGALGIHTTSLVAIMGAAGLAVGLALQGSLSNFAAGVLLIIYHPFKTGDYIEAGGAIGSVVSIQIFNTVLKTSDNKEVIIPNGTITGGNIVNYSAHDTRRINMTIGIGYNDDIKQAREILERILAEDDRILKEPAATVALSELADSSVNFVVRPWVKSSDNWSVSCDLREKVKLAFDAAGISIPYPQTDVHLFKEAS